jgi:hypothetical protein
MKVTTASHLVLDFQQNLCKEGNLLCAAVSKTRQGIMPTSTQQRQGFPSVTHGFVVQTVNEIRCQFVFSGKNDELTPDFLPDFLELTPDFLRYQ